MNLKKYFQNEIRGWLPKESNLPSNKVNVSAEGNMTRFVFSKRFWISLAVSYSLFLLLVVLPFLLGYIDGTILGYGLAGIVWSLFLMVIVRLLNGADIVLRKRIGIVALGVWLGFAVGVVGGTLTFGHQIIAAIGSLAYFVLVIIALPFAGGLIGFLAGKRKYSNQISVVEELKN